METLYSLAGMFANNEEPKTECKSGNDSLDAGPSTLQEPSEIDSPSIDFFLLLFVSFLHNFIILLFFKKKMLSFKYVVYIILQL